MSTREPSSLEHTLGHVFARPELLEEALTHSTYANEHPAVPRDNERLEYLGDAVLGLLVASLLYEEPRDAGEGEMSRRRARVVRTDALATMAESLEIDRWLKLGQGQRVEGPGRKMLADAFEAVMGAMYLDAGFDVVARCYRSMLQGALDRSREILDFKTHLQEICHREGRGVPQYEVLDVSGPDHARRFHCAVWIGAEVFGRGEGSSKKVAEQECAREAVAQLEDT